MRKEVLENLNKLTATVVTYRAAAGIHVRKKEDRCSTLNEPLVQGSNKP